ncbi:MAG TPA: hypothetical protein VFR32_07445 [Gaiellaceae bacterium]|nr:hypothetical protein [Gaiellaceae bacterium]
MAVVLGAASAVTVFRNDVARATGLAPPSTQALSVQAVGHAILVAEDLTVPVATKVDTPWIDTSDCERMFLVVRGYTAPPAALEFYTSMDGAAADTWWSDDTEDNFNIVEPGLDAASWTYSFSAHGQQPAAAPFARVSFKHGEPTPETVDKAWIYCVR